MLKKHTNGANIIVLNESDEILVVKQNYGGRKWILPGGAIERGETPRHAAQEEAEEESGLNVYEHKMKLIALCTQRLGLLALYETNYFDGNISTVPTPEISAVKFMSFQEIIDKRDEFEIGYIRMIIMHRRCRHGLDTPVVERRLVDKIEYPKGLDLEFDGVLLQI